MDEQRGLQPGPFQDRRGFAGGDRIDNRSAKTLRFFGRDEGRQTARVQHGLDRRDRAIIFRQGAGAQQYEGDIDAKQRLHARTDMEQQHLRAMRMGVMSDQQQALALFRRPRHGARGGVQKCGAEMLIGFEIGALGPFVPGVDADHGLAEKSLAPGAFDQFSQPGFIFRRRRVVDREAGALPARVIVPTRNGGLDERKIRRGLIERGGDDGVIIENVAIESRIEHFHRGVDVRHVLRELVRWKFDGAVEPIKARVVIVETLRHDENGIFAEFFAENAPPVRQGRSGMIQQAGAINHQQRPSAEPDIARIVKMPREIGADAFIVGGAVILRDQHVLVFAVPAPGPVFIRPHQGEGHVDVARGEEILERFFQQALAVETVVIEHEAGQSGVSRHRRLTAHDIDVVEAVIAEIARNARLVMIVETRLAARDIGPFGEALAPPAVVFRNGVKLRQIKSQDFRASFRLGREGGEFGEALPGPGEFLDRGEGRPLLAGEGRAKLTPVLAGAIMGERIDVFLSLQETLGIGFAVEIGGGVAPLAKADGAIMFERIRLGRHDVGIGGKIIMGVEFRDRVEGGGTAAQIMQHRACQLAEFVMLPIPLRVEQRRGIATRLLAEQGVIEQGIEAGSGDRRIGGHIPERVEHRIGAIAVLIAAQEEMLEQVLAGRDGVMGGIVAFIKKARLDKNAGFGQNLRGLHGGKGRNLLRGHYFGL